jgi:F5/8 type C domain-containing protein
MSFAEIPKIDRSVATGDPDAPPRAGPADSPSEAAPRSQTRPLLHQIVGTSRTLGSWFTERAPLRVVLVRWILLASGILATLTLWHDPSAHGNLARNASVTLSTICDELPEYSPFPAEPSRLVDGKKDRAYDTCTAPGPGSWLEVDLGARAVLDRVIVVGRADCCWSQHTLPVVLEVSDDGRAYREVERRSLPFTRDEPWIIALRQQTARQLRLRVDSTDPRSQIVLLELEAFGHAL